MAQVSWSVSEDEPTVCWPDDAVWFLLMMPHAHARLLQEGRLVEAILLYRMWGKILETLFELNLRDSGATRPPRGWGAAVRVAVKAVSD